jgi:hypothetical protein
MPWIANPNSDGLDIGTVLAVANSASPSGHRPVLKVGDELSIGRREEEPSRAEVIQKSPDEMVLALEDGTRLRLTASESAGSMSTEDWIVSERW